MTFEAELSRALADAINETSVPRRLGTVGFQNENGTWDVIVPNAGPRIFVTVDGGRVTAINTVAPLITGFPVSVAYHAGREPVVDRIDAFAAAAFMQNKFYTGVAPHSHRMNSGNPDYVEAMRYEPGLIVPDATGPLYVRVLPFFYYDSGAWHYCAGETPYNLSANLPVTENTRRWVLMGVNVATGALEATSGSDYDVDEDHPSSAIADVAYTGIRLAGIRVYEGQTTAPNVTADYVDARDWFGSGSGGGSLTVKEADGTPTVTSVTEIRVTNGTLTDEGGGAVTITTGGGGGSLTVKEADGTPTVTGVDTIVVTNATLTDDGGGQVTLTTGGGGGFPDDYNVFRWMYFR